MKYLIIIITCFSLASWNQREEPTDPYILEITSFQYKDTVNPDYFWKEDAKIQETYTSKQPGFISRESAYNEEGNEVLVVVRWKSETDAEASMNKFMNDTSVAPYAKMIEGSTMKMMRYNVK